MVDKFVYDFFELQLREDADVVAVGAEVFNLLELGGAYLVADDEHLHGGRDAAVEFGTEALDGGGHLVALHVELLIGAGHNGDFSIERIGRVGSVELLREVAAGDLLVLLNLRRWGFIGLLSYCIIAIMLYCIIVIYLLLQYCNRVLFFYCLIVYALSIRIR